MADKLGGARIRRGVKGNIRYVDHSEEAFKPKGRAKTSSAIAAQYIREVLGRTQWRIAGPRGAAAILGLNPSTLRSRIKKLGIARPG